MTTERAPLARLALAALAACLPLLGCDGGGRSAGAPPEEAVRANILGTAYLGQQKWAEAADAFRQALEVVPDDPRPRNNLAVALIQQGRNEEAQQELERALDADPDFPWARFNLGLLAKNAGDYDSAARHFEAVAAVDPDDLLTRYNLGIVLSRVGRPEDAEAAFRRALELEPTHVSSLYGLGRLLLERGETDEGARLVTLSQEIRARSGLDAAVGTQYGEQGPYAMGSDYPGDALAAPDAIPVAFAAAGALETAGAPAGDGPAWTAAPVGADGRVALLGVGEQKPAVLVDGVRVDFPSYLPSGARVPALTAADVDDDGLVDLALLVRHGEELLFGVLRQEVDGAVVSFRWSPAGLRAAAPPAPALGGLRADLVAVDRDHDGDLDLFWCWTGAETGSGCRLATNDGSGAFAVAGPETHGLDVPPLDPGGVRVAFSDLDNDRDVDLIVLHPGGLHWLSNQRDGTFVDAGPAAGLGAAAGGTDLQVADLDKDGFMDLVVAGAKGARLFLNRRGVFEPSDGFPSGIAGGRAVVFDHDNDGLLDAAFGDGEGAVDLRRNLGRGRWGRASEVDGLPRALPLGAVDVDLDGDADLIGWADGALRVFDNDGGNANRWIAVRPVGVGDNGWGIGSKVEILAGALRQKFEVRRPLPLLVGLGSRDTVQSVRFLWPSGVLQDEVDRAAGALERVEQLDRKGTSCPLLYAWDGDGWRFVTDFLGGAAVGYRLGPDAFNVPDTDEAVRIEGGIAPHADGTLRLRINNQLEEVLWFDRAQLIAVDHPAGTEVHPEERLLPGPPYSGFRLFVSGDVRPLRAARAEAPSGGASRDVTGILAARDDRHVEGFAPLPFKGYAEPHALELDLGALDRGHVERGGRVVLLLDGWIDYADSTSNLAAAQAGVKLDPPRLLLDDGRGGWRAADRRIGFPAGLPKTMTVDLTGLLAGGGPHRVRIETNMRIYWDRARVLVGGESIEPEVHRLEPRRADLRFGGFPVERGSSGPTPKAYDPARVESYRWWKAHAGRYTAHGDVRDLLLAVDDRMVTTRNGDEIELAFDAPPPPAAGRTRTYLFFADGFGKDMDPNSAAPDAVGPIPFHGMPHYPYGPDVAPPERVVEGTLGGRWVAPRDDGLHGAVPQAYAATVRPDAPR